MGDNIPLEVQQEIVKRIDDVKTLLRCTSVSKTWYSFIKNPEFISDYHIQRQTHNLLLVDRFKNYVSMVDDVDDDAVFPQNKLPIPLPDPVKRFRVLGYSLGLFCLIIPNGYGIDDDDDIAIGNPMEIIVWNPSIRKSIIVNYMVTPSDFNENYCQTFGFGVSPRTNDPVIIKITYSKYLPFDDDDDEDLSLDSITSFPVEVYTLSSRVWTTLSICLPRKTIRLAFGQVVIGEFIYWIAEENYTFVHNDYPYRLLILSFDMTTQEFIEVSLPEEMARAGHSEFYLSKLQESLVVVEIYSEYRYIVWKMKFGVPNSFAKLYTIESLNTSIFFNQLRFGKSGGLIALMRRESSQDEDLFVYEPDSKHTYKIGIHGTCNYINTYMETLLLLNQ